MEPERVRRPRAGVRQRPPGVHQPAKHAGRARRRAGSRAAADAGSALSPRGAVAVYSERSFENARRARDDLFGIQNGRKALVGRLAGLLDPEFFAKLAARQGELQQKIDAGNLPEAAAAYAKIAAAQKAIAENAPVYDYAEGRRLPQAFNTTLFGIARTLVRAAEERPKPNDVRLPEFRESNRPSLELQLFSTAPIYDDFEILKLTDSLTALCGEFGADEPHVQKVLGGKSPRERAEEFIHGMKLKDVAVRRKLYEAAPRRCRIFPIRSSSWPGASIRLPAPRARSLRSRTRSSNKRTRKYPRRALRSKAPATIRMPRLRCGWPTGPTRVTKRAARQYRPLRISPAYTAARPNTKTSRPLICLQAGLPVRTS